MDGKLGFGYFLLLCVIAGFSLFGVVQSSEEVMKDITNAFGKVLKECTVEEGLSKTTMLDFYNYWKEDYALLNRDFGCAIVCVSKKLNLITADHKLHHENTKDFVQTFGADESMAKQLVDMLHACERDNEGIADHCERALGVAKCFRTRTHELKWVPKIGMIVGEVLTEM